MVEGEIKSFHDTNRLKEFMSTQPVLHRILQWVVFGKVTHYDQTGFNLEIHGRFNLPKPANKIKHTDGFDDKNHPIISIDTEKSFDKIQQGFMIKALDTIGLEGRYLSIIKAVYDKRKPNSILNGENPEAIPLKSGLRKGCPPPPLLFRTVLETLSGSIKQEGKEIKGT